MPDLDAPMSLDRPILRLKDKAGESAGGTPCIRTAAPIGSAPNACCWMLVDDGRACAAFCTRIACSSVDAACTTVGCGSGNTMSAYCSASWSWPSCRARVASSTSASATVRACVSPAAVRSSTCSLYTLTASACLSSRSYSLPSANKLDASLQNGPGEGVRASSSSEHDPGHEQHKASTT